MDELQAILGVNNRKFYIPPTHHAGQTQDGVALSAGR
jgi:hypothetical protein